MPRQLVTIQYLRGLSAIGIVLFHATWHHHVMIPIGEGRIALFFIVSGFILWWITAGRDNDPSDFMLRRLARLAPLYWLVTALLFGASLAGLSTHAPVTVQQFVASLLFIPHLNAAGQVFPVLVPGWTLVYEMFFCVMFALLLLLPERQRLWVATAFLGGLASLGVAFHPTGPILATYTNQILLEFLFGIWLAHLWRRIRLSAGWAWAMLGLGVGLSFLLEPLRDSAWPALINGGPALLIVAGALALERPASKPIGWLKYVGDASYSIYLWHIPVLVLSESIARHLHFTALVPLILWDFSAGIAAGLILYASLERPFTAWLFQVLRRRRALPVAQPA